MDFSKNKLFKILKEIGFEQDEYAIFGSGIMFAVGIRKLSDLEDLDLIVNARGWEKSKKLGKILKSPDWPAHHIEYKNGGIDIYNGWGPGKYDVEKLIKNSLNISGFNFVSFEDTIHWKKEMGREKDLKHVKMIMNYLKANRNEKE